MKTLDAAIKLFAPEYATDEIKSKQHREYSKLFAWGECYRLTLQSLRELGGSATVPALVNHLMGLKHIPVDQNASVTHSVKTSVYQASKTKLVHRTGTDGLDSIWTLV